MARTGRNVVESASAPKVGDVLGGRWRLLREIGHGLVSTVFEAEGAEGHVAVSVLDDELVRERELCSAFVAAGKEAARVGHADSVQVLGEGISDDGYPFVVAELLEGETFAKLMQRRRGRLYPAESLRLVRDALDVVAAAHDNGVIHGELTPSRLLITDGGTIKVLGFGVAALRKRAAAQLGLASVPDTTAYLSPEQAQGNAATKVSDLFALGAVLFSLLTGKSVHDGDTDAERLDSARSLSTRSLSSVAPAAPSSLVALLARAVAPAPAKRFPDARAMRAALDQALMLPELVRLRSLFDATPLSTPRAPASSRSSEPPLSYRRTVPAPPDSVPVPTTGIPTPGAPRATTGSGRYGSVQVQEKSARRAGWRQGLADTMPALTPDTVSEPAQRPAAAPDSLHGLQELFRQLERALEARLAGSADAARETSALLERATALLGDRRTALHWNVTQHGFATASGTVWQPHGELARIPARLFADGVRLLALLPGLELAEVSRLLEILLFDSSTSPSREDDLVTLLWQSELPHVMHHAVVPFANGQAEARFEQNKHETLALVRFDTSFQLEECWQDVRPDVSHSQWRESLLRAIARRVSDDGQTCIGGRSALRVDPAEREATAARLASEDRVSTARFEAVLRSMAGSSQEDTGQ